MTCSISKLIEDHVEKAVHNVVINLVPLDGRQHLSDGRCG
ncbi:hypothetical protein CGRA01v4_11100 [Colletotrichum graminicola]|nr:hypothetical protein CGRA01v4_11100 [Colletotrichum graminicola]